MPLENLRVTNPVVNTAAESEAVARMLSASGRVLLNSERGIKEILGRMWINVKF